MRNIVVAAPLLREAYRQTLTIVAFEVPESVIVQTLDHAQAQRARAVQHLGHSSARTDICLKVAWSQSWENCSCGCPVQQPYFQVKG